MPTAHFEQGFAFRFYSNDHLPMHIHAVHGDEVCVFLLGDVEEREDEDGRLFLAVLEAPSTRENKGMKLANVRRALAIIEANQSKLIAAWRGHLG